MNMNIKQKRKNEQNMCNVVSDTQIILCFTFLKIYNSKKYIYIIYVTTSKIYFAQKW